MNLSEKQFEFYIEELCPRGDDALRLAYMLILNKQGAWKCVSKTYDKLLTRLAQAEVDLSFALVQCCWQAFHEHGSWASPESTSFAQSMKALTVEERSALAASDIFGLSADLAAKALERDSFQLRQDISQARQKLLGIEFV